MVVLAAGGTSGRSGMPSGTGPTGGIAGTAGAAGMSVAGEDDAAERPPVHAVLPQAPHAAHLRSRLQVRAVRFLDHGRHAQPGPPLPVERQRVRVAHPTVLANRRCLQHMVGAGRCPARPSRLFAICIEI